MWSDLRQDHAGDEFTVREARPADAAAALDLMNRLVLETPYMLVQPEELSSSVDAEARFIRALRRSGNSLMLLAERNGAPIGLLTLTGGTLSRIAHTVALGMGVLESDWGRGIGGALVDDALLWAGVHPLVRKVTLQVYASNTRALGLYLSRGFAFEGRLARAVLGAETFEDLYQLARFVDEPLGP